MIKSDSPLDEVSYFLDNLECQWDLNNNKWIVNDLSVEAIPNKEKEGFCQILIYQNDILIAGGHYSFSELDEQEYFGRILEVLDFNNLFEKFTTHSLKILDIKDLAGYLSDFWIDDPRKEELHDLSPDEIRDELHACISQDYRNVYETLFLS